MRNIVSFLLLMIAIKCYSQNSKVHNLVGKTFISEQQGYLQIISDSTLHSSITNSYSDTIYCIKNNILNIKHRELTTYRGIDTDSTYFLNYPIINLYSDTLVLINPYSPKSDNSEDTLFFINLEKKKEPVNNFQYLKLDMVGPWYGELKVEIDKNRNIKYDYKPIPYSADNPDSDSTLQPNYITGKFTNREYTIFEDFLSKAMVTTMPLKRGCPLDGGFSNFEIKFSDKLMKSEGCDLSWTQRKLLNYLSGLGKNKVIVKKE